MSILANRPSERDLFRIRFYGMGHISSLVLISMRQEQADTLLDQSKAALCMQTTGFHKWKPNEWEELCMV